MDFSPSALHQLLSPPARAYWVAFSGGCDSTVLLHALVALRDHLAVPVSAVHVDHGLHPHSAEWSRRCEALCARWDVPYITLRVDAHAAAGESREAAARRARYVALAAVVNPGEVLLTAHHRDDQAETFLLQLLRGAGPRGLAAMPAVTPFAQGQLQRPLLGFSRRALCAYAAAHDLAWIDDPSNADVGFDRNFLRHRVFPLLAQEWPAADAVIARAARLQAESSGLLDDLARLDGAAVCDGVPHRLRIAPLTGLAPARQRNLLRHALRARGLPLPSSVVLERILTEVVTARDDGEPCVTWPGAEVRRHRGVIHLLPPLPPVPEGRLAWDGRGALALPAGLGTLRARRTGPRDPRRGAAGSRLSRRR